MNLNFDSNKNLSNRAAQDASFHDQERKEKNRLEIPNEEERDTFLSFSFFMKNFMVIITWGKSIFQPKYFALFTVSIGEVIFPCRISLTKES